MSKKSSKFAGKFGRNLLIMKQRSLPIVLGVFLVVAMTVQFFVSYQREKTDLIQQMEYKMESAQKGFVFEIYDMHEATDEITHFFPEFDTDTADLYALLEAVLLHYPDLYCCYVTFPPDCDPFLGEWRCPSAFRVNRDSVITYDSRDRIPYQTRDWYIGAMKSDDEGYWSLPYNDGTHADPVFTYSQKVYNRRGQFVGVAGADYTLAWTERLLEDIKPYDDAICQLISADGTLIVGSGGTADMRDRILFEKVLSPTNMRLVISVPKCHIRREITGISLITLAVLLSGILAIGLLLRHIRKEHDAFTRMETTNKLMEHEMQIAHDIQMGILKSEEEKRKAERNGDIELHALLLPMREVGGDLYDFHREKDDLWFIIGDVSGKGVPAAMFMSAAMNLFRAAGVRANSPKEIMEEMNAVLSENNPSLTFVTAFIGCLHIPTGELLYCNAGHCAPLIVESKKSKVKTLEMEPNIPLGYNGNYSFVEQGCMLGEGETLVLYTDGVTEARNNARQMLGMERWCKIVERKESRVKSKKSRVESLLGEVRTFMGNAEPTDDITLMTIRKMEPVEPVTLCVPNKEDQWPVIRRTIREFGLCSGLDAKIRKKLEVAAEEAVVNIFHYSQATEIGIAITQQPSAVSLQLMDDGVAFDPTVHVPNANATEERQIGGMGISLMRQITDEMHYERAGEKNILTLVKKL